MTVEPRDLETLRQAIASESAVSELFFVLRTKETDDGKSVYSLGLRRVGLTEEVAKELRDVLEGWLASAAQIGTLKFEDFDPDFTPGSGAVIQTLPVSEVPELPGLLAAIDDSGKVPEPKRIDSEFLAALWAVAVRVDSEAGRAVFFRRYYGSKVARVDQPLRFLYHGKKLSKSKSTVVFSFDDKLDVLVLGEKGKEVALVLQKNIFEQMFFMTEKVYAPRAKKAKEMLRSRDLIENFSELSEMIDKDPAKIKKTAEIGRNVKAAQLEFPALKKIADEWDVALEVNEEKTAFVATSQTVWPLIKLLADDNLESRLTKNKYEVSSKRLIR